MSKVPPPTSPLQAGWLCPSYRLTESSQTKIQAWMQKQSWPEGTELKTSDKLHITAFYSRVGYHDADLHHWIENQNPISFKLRTQAVENFDSGDRDNQLAPVVLVLTGPLLEVFNAKLVEQAQEKGLPLQLHASGYRPHITVAKSSEPVELTSPDFTVDVDKLYELHRYYDGFKRLS